MMVILRTIKKPRTFTFIIVMSLILISSLFFLTNNTSSPWASAASQGSVVGKGTKSVDSSKFILVIDGMDYSTLKALVWVTTDGRILTKIINPVALLDPEDDGYGLIQVPLEFKKGLIKAGDSFTACIRVLYDSDKYGDHVACQKGIVSGNAKSFSQSQTAPSSSATTSVNNNGIRVRISL
jgi:hypothetical protein